MNRYSSLSLVFVLLASLASGLMAQPVSTIGTVVTRGPAPKLYDIRSNGSLVNPRSISWSGLSSFSFIGLTENDSGGFVSLTHPFSGSTHAQHRFGISNAGAASISSGPLGVSFEEGAVARHPTTGDLWAVTSGGDIYRFVGGSAPTLEMSFSVTSLGISASQCAGATFSASGDLFVLSLGAGGQIFQVDVGAEAIVGLTTIGATVVGGDGGMDFNVSNPSELVVVAPVFDGSAIRQRLLRVNLATGTTTDQGQTSLSTITGLVVTRPFGGLIGMTAEVELAGILSPVGGGGINVGDVLRVRARESALIDLTPRTGRHVGSPTFLFIQEMLGGEAPTANSMIPRVYLDFGRPDMPTALLNGVPLPQGGLKLPFVAPASLSGHSFMLQAAMLSQISRLGFESTRAIEVHFQ